MFHLGALRAISQHFSNNQLNRVHKFFLRSYDAQLRDHGAYESVAAILPATGSHGVRASLRFIVVLINKLLWVRGASVCDTSFYNNALNSITYTLVCTHSEASSFRLITPAQRCSNHFSCFLE